jgi:hypothetical protein
MNFLSHLRARSCRAFALCFLLVAAIVHAQTPRALIVVDLRGEVNGSRSFLPHFALAQRLITEGFSGDVIALVDEDYKSAGWAKDFDLSDSMPKNVNGGQLSWMTPSQTTNENRAVDLYLKFESTPEGLLAEIVGAPGLLMTEETIFMKLSLLEHSDRPAVEAVAGASVTDKNFDGFFIHRGAQVELQALPLRMEVPAIMKAAGEKNYSDYLVNHESPLLASEILLALYDIPRARKLNLDPHSHFLALSKKFVTLRSRIRLKLGCGLSVAKKKV